MNARLYDPTLGRFLSADPIIQDPYDTQAFNRYSYVRNNPLKYTDPSGYSWLSKIFKVIVAIFVAVVAYALLGPGGGFAAELLGTSSVAAGLTGVQLGAAMGAVMGFGGTLINGGSFKDALLNGFKGAIFGAISAGVAAGIGDWAGTLDEVVDGHTLSFFTEGSFGPALAKATMHGLTRGLMHVAQGGKFGAGFASGFVTGGFAVNKSWGTVESRTVVAALAGGVTSEITGGKFANGAITGAFVHLFNHENINQYEQKPIRFTHEDLREAAALKIMESSGGVPGIKWGSNLTYEQAYDKVLQIEAFNEQANRVLISLAVGGAGSVVVRGGYYYVMANPEKVFMAVGIVDGYYGGMPPSDVPGSIGKTINEFYNRVLK